jgi:hypothetical protein
MKTSLVEARRSPYVRAARTRKPLMSYTIKRPSSLPLSLRLRSSETIREVKDMIERLMGIAWDQQRIICGDLELQDHKTLDEYSVTPESIIYLVTRLEKN